MCTLVILKNFKVLSVHYLSKNLLCFQIFGVSASLFSLYVLYWDSYTYIYVVCSVTLKKVEIFYFSLHRSVPGADFGVGQISMRTKGIVTTLYWSYPIDCGSREVRIRYRRNLLVYVLSVCVRLLGGKRGFVRCIVNPRYDRTQSRALIILKIICNRWAPRKMNL